LRCRHSRKKRKGKTFIHTKIANDGVLSIVLSASRQKEPNPNNYLGRKQH
jgi:hypothetical protein